MNWEPITEKDRHIIQQQLQRQPRNLYGIARRCWNHCPQVVINHPLAQTEKDVPFFPTVFWLTCPEAVRRISRIEDQGAIQRIQEHINGHMTLSRHMRDAHLEYIYIRRSLLGPVKMLEIREQKKDLARDLESVGIGGLSDFRSIKCLHMHYAHYLVTYNNLVGHLVEKMLQLNQKNWDCHACPRKMACAGVAE